MTSQAGGIPLGTLTGVSWAFAGLATVLTAFRMWVRFFVIKGLASDDISHVSSLVFLLVQVSLVTSATTTAYHFADSPNPELINLTSLLRINFAGIIIVWACLYAVKVTFLLLYRRIFQVSQRFMQAWWTVMVIVVLMFVASVAGSLTQCGNPSQLGSSEKCQTPSAVRRERQLVVYCCVFNVFTDVLIMALPLVMLKNLQMRTTAKLGLVGVFGCAIITIAFDIVRSVETLTRGSVVGTTALFTNLESAIAVIVSCLPSFAGLFSIKKRRYGGRSSSPYQARSRSKPISDSAELFTTVNGSIRSGVEGHTGNNFAAFDKGKPYAGSEADAYALEVPSARANSTV